METLKFDVFSIDAWGNEEDGWEQNDYFPVARGLEIGMEPLDADVLAILQSEGLISEQATLNDVEFYWSDCDVAGELVDAKTRKPLYQFRTAY